MSETPQTVDDLIEEASRFTATDPDRARPLLRRALDLSPFDPRIHGQLGITESEAGNLEEAATHLESATDLEPDDPRNWYDLGVVQLRRSQIDDARDCFEMALTRRTDYVDALLNLGICYEKIGDVIAASAAWGRTIDLDPTKSRATAATVGLARLASSRAHDLRPMHQYVACRDAVEDDLWLGVKAFRELLPSLDDCSRGYWIAAQQLANALFLIGDHLECHNISARVRSALPCVSSLVIERYRHLVDFSKNRDAERVYASLIERTFSRKVRLVMFVKDSQRGVTPDWHDAQVTCDDGIYTVRRGGNLFVITSPGGAVMVRQAYDRSDLITGPL